MSKIMIVKSREWGKMPAIHVVPGQLRLLINKSGNPVANEWLRLIGDSRIEEITVADSEMDSIVNFIKCIGLISRDVARTMTSNENQNY